MSKQIIRNIRIWHNVSNMIVMFTLVHYVPVVLFLSGVDNYCFSCFYKLCISCACLTLHVFV